MCVLQIADERAPPHDAHKTFPRAVYRMLLPRAASAEDEYDVNVFPGGQSLKRSSFFGGEHFNRLMRRLVRSNVLLSARV